MSTTTPPTCPSSPLMRGGGEHTVIGCGSANVAEDASEPGVWDCLDCGIWFIPELEVDVDPASDA